MLTNGAFSAKIFMQANITSGGVKMEIDALKVKVLMAEQRKTQVKLSEECSVSRQNISRILAKGRCSPITAGKIAEGLGVHVSAIMKGVQ